MKKEPFLGLGETAIGGGGTSRVSLSVWITDVRQKRRSWTLVGVDLMSVGNVFLVFKKKEIFLVGKVKKYSKNVKVTSGSDGDKSDF